MLSLWRVLVELFICLAQIAKWNCLKTINSNGYTESTFLNSWFFWGIWLTGWAVRHFLVMVETINVKIHSPPSHPNRLLYAKGPFFFFWEDILSSVCVSVRLRSLVKLASYCIISSIADWFLFFRSKIFKSMKEYEEKAVSLALNRPKLQDLSNRLKAARLTCPLFDTVRWVSSLVFILFNISIFFLS